MSLISARGLTHVYPGGVTALEGLDVELEPGIIGFVGANGAGKSTFIKILLGLLQPTGGEVRVFDLDTRREGVRIRERVGYMPEHDCLPPDMTATDFVAHMGRVSGLPRTAARERTAEMLRHVGLYEERYRPIGGYSTGMKQRVKLAQALVHDPALLLLDEPTNGLDPAGREEMLELIRRTGREFGIAVLVSSHLLGEIERVAEFLVAIEGGRLKSAAPLGSFTGAQQLLAVEVDEGAEALCERLAAAGLPCQREGALVLVPLLDERPYDAVRDAAADLGLALVRMERRHDTLRDLFRSPVADPAERKEASDAPLR
jgi:ABC-2 type transport system ATP-binding protein